MVRIAANVLDNLLRHLKSPIAVQAESKGRNAKDYTNFFATILLSRWRRQARHWWSNMLGSSWLCLSSPWGASCPTKWNILRRKPFYFVWITDISLRKPELITSEWRYCDALLCYLNNGKVRSTNRHILHVSGGSVYDTLMILNKSIDKNYEDVRIKTRQWWALLVRHACQRPIARVLSDDVERYIYAISERREWLFTRVAPNTLT